MFFASDNAGPAHPRVMNRVLAANIGHEMPYGNDKLMEEVREKARAVFEAPDAAVYLVATGTAANALALACYTDPWQTVFCARPAHIEQDECNAPEFYTAGAKLSLIDTDNKLTPADLTAAIKAHPKGVVHGAQPGTVSVTQITERGTVYKLKELRALTSIAREHALPVHLDGARFANACAKLDCTAAQMSWKAGIDVVSFGGTKNGCLGVEAVIFFDPQKAWEFELRRKRGAHLFSKHRYLSAQMAGYLTDNAWIDIARAANARAAYLADGLRAAGAEFLYPPDANMIFTRFPRAIHRALHAAGARYYLIDGALDGPEEEPLAARLVCDWSIEQERIDQFLSFF
ncbi:MAG: beta-eliminating lyase-related protein [Pseudomonadota bacterium]